MRCLAGIDRVEGEGAAVVAAVATVTGAIGAKAHAVKLNDIAVMAAVEARVNSLFKFFILLSCQNGNGFRQPARNGTQ